MSKLHIGRLFALAGLLLAPLGGCDGTPVETPTRSEGAATWYVEADAPVTGDGRSWETAMPFLRDALAMARAGDTIRVGPGRYTPDRSAFFPDGTGDVTATFELVDRVALLGGYAGRHAPAPDANDPGRFFSTLSGDLAGDDMPLGRNRGDNARHVVTAVDVGRQTFLYGFIVSGGRAAGPAPFPGTDQMGGGLLLWNASPTIHGCTFSDNYALMNGGAIAGAYRSAPRVVDTGFQGNTAEYGQGGAVQATWESRMDFASVVFTHNEARAGGALAATIYSAPTLHDATFIGNRARTGDGGAVYAATATAPFMDSVTFRDNRAARAGGAYFLGNAQIQATLVNAVFEGNEAVGAGAVRVEDGASLRIVNCTFYRNRSLDSHAGALEIAAHRDVPLRFTSIINSIFYGNTMMWRSPIRLGPPARLPSQLAGEGDYPAGLEVYYSDIEGGEEGVLSRSPAFLLSWALGNLDADPRFSNPAAHDLRLAPGSPCIDRGSNEMMPDFMKSDMNDAPRSYGARVDIGAFEYVP